MKGVLPAGLKLMESELIVAEPIAIGSLVENSTVGESNHLVPSDVEDVSELAVVRALVPM